MVLEESSKSCNWFRKWFLPWRRWFYFIPIVYPDFLFIPTKYADAFAKAATLHIKHGVSLEVAYSKIVDLIVRGSSDDDSGATVHNMDLCTTWFLRRGSDKMMRMDCYSTEKNFGFIHPFKISQQGFSHWSSTYDKMQMNVWYNSPHLCQVR